MSAEEKFTSIPNPYIVGNPIKDGEMFYGRQDEFLFAKRKIETGDKSYVIVLCGERRSGKTSILFQILSGKLGERFLPVLIDMQTMAGLENDGDFFEEFAQEICRTLKDARLNIDEYNFHVPNESPYKCFRELLDKILSLYPGKHLVLMIDEYEMMEAKFDEGSLSPEVITFFADLLDGERHLSFVFTGSRHLEQRQKSKYWQLLYDKSLYCRISFLPRHEAIRLMIEPVRDYVHFSDDAVERIYRLTTGQPYYTQAICQCLVDHLNEVKKNRAELADIDVVMQHILNNPLPQMIYAWNSLQEIEKLVLAALAVVQKNAESGPSVAVLYDYLKKKDSDILMSRKDLTAALEYLISRDLVIHQNGAYRVGIELLAQWIQREQPLWKIIQESKPRASSLKEMLRRLFLLSLPASF